jgi:SAM-dependent methyltransferase
VDDARSRYDPTIYSGSAPYYARGRPPYSRELAPRLREALGLDGTGRLLDVGCGPGTLALELAPLFAATVGLEPDAEMLREAERRARESGCTGVRWVSGLAEELPALGLGSFRLVTFGQSFHWTDRERVAESVYDLLEPGSALALVVHTVPGRPTPDGPGPPPIPHDAIRAVVERYLGPRRRVGKGFYTPHPDRFEHALARTRFGVPDVVFCPGRADLVQDVDGVLANFLSTSWCAPHHFGERLASFESEVRALLERASPSGLFWDWPGDTEVLLARRKA